MKSILKIQYFNYCFTKIHPIYLILSSMHVYIRRRHTVPYRRRFSLIKPNYKLYLLNESTYGYDLVYSTQLSSV